MSDFSRIKNPIKQNTNYSHDLKEFLSTPAKQRKQNVIGRVSDKQWKFVKIDTELMKVCNNGGSLIILTISLLLIGHCPSFW